jgi:GH15 family glucan-1,4-alpha-glucosidase
MCWSGCDRLAKIAKKLNHLDREKFWADAAVEIKQFIMERAWDPEQNSLIAVCSGETKELDAALLLVGELGFLAPDDPKFIGTVEVSVFVSSSCLNMSKRIGKILKKGDFLYRYVEKDDFGLPENAFTICTFWYVNALAYIGRKAEARELFEKLLSKRNHVGLFSEDLDVHTGELWGNFPQTYSMVGLINSAIWLSKSWTDAGLC